MRTTFASCVLPLLAGAATSLGGVASNPSDTLPIREVTVFKDGHAMILRHGTAPTDAGGNVSFGELPHPVLGTFWAWEDEANGAVHSVCAGRETVTRSRSPETIAELIEANVGAAIQWEGSPAVIEAVLTKSVEPPAPRRLQPDPQRRYGWRGYYYYNQPIVAQDRPDNDPAPGAKTVLIRLLDGGSTVAVPMASLAETFTFADNPGEAVFEERSEEDRLTIRLDWEGEPEARADVGVMYVERGLRWIPSYKITILDDYTVRLDLQATLINEIADLRDVTANLVVGVPSFAFEKTPDPMGLQEFLVDLGPFFRENTTTAGALSNALMTQIASAASSAGSERPPGFDTGDTGNREDLYIFTVHGLTLARGERATVPLSSVELPCERVFTLDIPFGPPDDVASSMGSEQQRQIAEQLGTPMVRQVLRITNTSDTPITTAPALIVRDSRPVAQQLIRYTSTGAAVDVEMTAAVDIGVQIEEGVSNRTPNAWWRGYSFMKVETTGAITLLSRKSTPSTIEVTRHILGFVDEASGDGRSTELSPFAERWRQQDDRWWWWSYGWPYWWSKANAFSTITWTVELEPGQSETLTWSSHYFHR